LGGPLDWAAQLGAGRDTGKCWPLNAAPGTISSVSTRPSRPDHTNLKIEHNKDDGDVNTGVRPRGWG
jgi:hypothetical protein